MSKSHLKPGQSVPTSGQYGVFGPRGGYLHQEVTGVRGKTLPPTPKPGLTGPAVASDFPNPSQESKNPSQESKNPSLDFRIPGQDAAILTWKVEIQVRIFGFLVKVPPP